MKIYIIATLIVLAILNPAYAQSEKKSVDETFVDIDSKVPGFGGMYVDGNQMKVYLTDISKKDKAISEISSIKKIPKGGVQILQGKYRFSDLKKWKDDAGILFDIPSLVYIDADEKLNRLSIGVDNIDLSTIVEQRLIQAGIPKDAIVVVKTDPIVYKYTLQSKIRPIQGGIQIRFTNYLCTESFNGIRNGVNGFVINSHCSGKQGGVQNTQFYQPINVIPDEFIGTEIADPDYTRAKCSAAKIRGKVCRYSDSAYASNASGVLEALGIVEKPDSANTGSLTVAGDFRITSEGSSIVGETVNKVGRTTGWSRGAVTRTDVNTGVSGTNIVQLRQDWVSASVGGGDSGSPVFSTINNPAIIDDVELRGILWGGDSAGTTYVYSPIANVQRIDELGLITNCAPGFSC